MSSADLSACVVCRDRDGRVMLLADDDGYVLPDTTVDATETPWAAAARRLNELGVPWQAMPRRCVATGDDAPSVVFEAACDDGRPVASAVWADPQRLPKLCGPKARRLVAAWSDGYEDDGRLRSPLEHAVTVREMTAAAMHMAMSRPDRVSPGDLPALHALERALHEAHELADGIARGHRTGR